MAVQRTKPKRNPSKEPKTERVRVGCVSVYLRVRKWWIYYLQNGKSHRHPVSHNKKDALRAAAEINAQIACGMPSMFGFERITVVHLVRRWLEHHDLVLRSSPATITRYRAATAHLLRFVGETDPTLTADAFGPREAEELAKSLRRSHVSPNGNPGTAKRPLRDKGLIFILEVCRNLFNYALRQRHLPPYSQNPFSSLRLDRIPVEDAKPIVLFSEAEEAAFLDACDEWQFPVFFTLAFTGMRPGEL